MKEVTKVGWVGSFDGFMIGLLFLALFFSSLNEAKNDLEICKELGYDGIKFEKVNLVKDKIVCSNFTDLEKARSSQERGLAK